MSGASRVKAAWRLTLALAAASTLPSNAAASVAAPDLVGRWSTAGGEIVAFGSCAEQVAKPLICGRLVRLKTEACRKRLDVQNPDPAQRGRHVLGLEILHGLTESSPGVWAGGDLYNPDDGHRYAGTIRLQGPDHLDLQGCALTVVCRAQAWRRVAP
ncbi:DUF2147 domain-containing protein [Phenylobacterium aquaticum]|uniref:DUF2147 domain-containing protein n=1 Tax=Phenylobacterium aquaticum TaxID=1763816 RepID=UPI001F5CC7C4|nr:DUF2147 domain-containing protein [Phenylobacterium aquaticum]MCI3132822.1 DUF2147 domain-containing protein [Phenylobacterium aquaticum]